MCLVEIEKSPKPIVACAMPIVPNMKVFTSTALVANSRENIVEFLLINHPLDCPICDQGGECDLQDQTFKYGSDKSRFFFSKKRAVEDKNLGAFLKTIMTRCIHCTRCVRFEENFSLNRKLGITGRGNQSEITTYLDISLNNGIIGNIIDLCPVGALTSKLYAFTARPWEIQTSNSIDIFDSLGSNIQINSLKQSIVRILPRSNIEINKEWCTDRIRFFFDCLSNQRLTNPLIKRQDGNFFPLRWGKALKLLRTKILTKRTKSSIVLGSHVDEKTADSIKKLNKKFSVKSYLESEGFLPRNLYHSFCLNNSLPNLKDNNQFITIDMDLEKSFPIFYMSLKERERLGECSFYHQGSNCYQFSNIKNLGNNLNFFKNLMLDRSLSIRKNLIYKKSLQIFVSSHSSNRKDYLSFFSLLSKLYGSFLLKTKNHLVNFLHMGSNLIGLLNNGFRSVNDFTVIKSSIILFLECNNVFKFLKKRNALILPKTKTKNVVNILVTPFWCKNFFLADFLLPTTSFVEKNFFTVNAEGRLQLCDKCIDRLGVAKDSSEVISSLMNAPQISRKKTFETFGYFLNTPYKKKDYVLFKQSIFSRVVFNYISENFGEKPLFSEKYFQDLQDNIIYISSNFLKKLNADFSATFVY